MTNKDVMSSLQGVIEKFEFRKGVWHIHEFVATSETLIMRHCGVN